MTGSADQQYAFCGHRLDGRRRELTGPGGAPVPLTSKAFDVLLQLIERREQVLGKEELLAAVWPRRVVEENNLTQAISALRKALGGDASDHRYIITVPGRGYRFVAAVRNVEEPGSAEPMIPISAASVPVTALPATPAIVPATGTPTSGIPASNVPVGRRTIALGALLVTLALFAAGAWRLRAAPPTQASQHTALAVLPFRSLSPGPRDEALELGMAETLIAQLSRSGALRVRSLVASQRLEGRNRDSVDSGRRLGAAHVVEGSTQLRGDWIRVNARLLNVADGRTLWAGTFDAHRDRVFTLQDRIAVEIGAALALPAYPVAAAVAAAHRSPCEGDSVEAYRAYVTGRYLLSRASAGRLPEALAALRRAIALDPSCARAHAGLASLYVSQALTADADPRTVIPLARAAVARSLAIDPASAEAYLAKGGIEAWSDWNWSLAAVSFQRAIALDPASADAHVAYSMALNSLGRGMEASDHVRHASELDPLSPIVNTTQAAYLFATDPAVARVRLGSVLELEPDYWAALVERSRWAMARSRPREAIADLQRAADRSHRNSVVMTHLAKAHLAAGERDRAEALLDELQARRRDGYVPATALAMIHVALGNTGPALDELERGYAERDVRMAYFTASRGLEALHGQSRFLALARRVGPEAERGLGRR